MTKHLTFILLSTVIIACSSGNKTEVKTTDNDIKSTDKIESKEITTDKIINQEDLEKLSNNEKEIIAEPVENTKPKKDQIPLVDKPKETKQPSIDSLSLKKEKVEASIFNHSTWDELLKKHVDAEGNVDYVGFKNDKIKLESYIKELQEQYTNLASFKYYEKLAYWINLYNAYTVKLIVDNYPTSSITKLKGGKPWDAKFIKLGNESFSLNNVENDIIRVRFNDPRIHVGVNCASISCPKLLNRAFTRANINIQLTMLMKNWLKDPSKNQITKDNLKLSKIFDWYKVDFTKNGTVIDFIQQYTDIEIDKNASIEYLEYNWNLNAK